MKSPSRPGAQDDGAFVPYSVTGHLAGRRGVTSSTFNDDRIDSAQALTRSDPFSGGLRGQTHGGKVREVDREQGICQIKPQYQIVEVFNLPILFFFGLMARLLAPSAPAVHGPPQARRGSSPVPHYWSLLLLLPGTEQGHAPGAVGVDAVVPHRVALHE